MNKRVYLSPSNQARNQYLIGNTTEKIVCEEIAGFLKAALVRCDVEVYGWQPTIAERIAESNRIGVDVYLAIHTNASAKGTEWTGLAQGVTVFTELFGTRSTAVSKAIYQELQKIYPAPIKSRGVQNGKFNEIIQPRAATPYLELAFHDNEEDAQWLLSNKKKIAEAICKGLCMFFVIPYRSKRIPLTAIAGKSIATAEQMRIYLKRKNHDAPDYADLYLEEGIAEGIRGDIAFAQSCVETDDWRFGGIVKPEQNNFAGIGAISAEESGNRFDTPREGIRAQIQHLKAYANEEPCRFYRVDPRFPLVKRASAPYVEWLGIPDNPTHIGWASGRGYGAAILRVLAEICRVSVTADPDEGNDSEEIILTREEWCGIFEHYLFRKEMP